MSINHNPKATATTSTMKRETDIIVAKMVRPEVVCPSILSPSAELLITVDKCAFKMEVRRALA